MTRSERPEYYQRLIDYFWDKNKSNEENARIASGFSLPGNHIYGDNNFLVYVPFDADLSDTDTYPTEWEGVPIHYEPSGPFEAY